MRLCILTVLFSLVHGYEPVYKKTFGSLVHDINSHSVSRIILSKDLTKVYVEEPVIPIQDESSGLPPVTVFNRFETQIHPLFASGLVDAANRAEVDTVVLQDPDSGSMLSSGLERFGTFVGNTFELTVISFLMVNLVRSLFMGRGQGPGQGGGGFMGLPSMKAGQKMVSKPNVSLDSWAGSPEVFEECIEIISFIRNASIYKDAGAEVPKGILLEGPPGTGKTLLAKAIAAESDASFISVSASEFVELYVGAGSLKVRNLFSEARASKPCIIFIDEIDAVGKQRGSGAFVGNDEREQTLNQLLFEMDGFSSNDGITVIAATNRRDILDKALLRPGRFDRIVAVPLPDRESRQAIFERFLQGRNITNSGSLNSISSKTNTSESNKFESKSNYKDFEKNTFFNYTQLLKNESQITNPNKGNIIITEIFHHTNNNTTPINPTTQPPVRNSKAMHKPSLNESLSEVMAKETAGFSGADIKNVINEAAIYAAREGRKSVSKQDMERALEKTLVGIVKNKETRTPDTLKRIAIHEMGHAFLASCYPEYFEVRKATIQNTYSGAGGYTLYSTREEFVDSGLYTKDLLLKQLTVILGGKAAETVFYGAAYVSNGASQDLKQANDLARQMIGTFGMGSKLRTFQSQEGRQYGPKTMETMDWEVHQLINEAYEEAIRKIEESRIPFDVLVKRLIEKRSLSGNDLIL